MIAFRKIVCLRCRIVDVATRGKFRVAVVDAARKQVEETAEIVVIVDDTQLLVCLASLETYAVSKTLYVVNLRIVRKYAERGKILVARNFDMHFLTVFELKH